MYKLPTEGTLLSQELGTVNFYDIQESFEIVFVLVFVCDMAPFLSNQSKS